MLQNVGNKRALIVRFFAIFLVIFCGQWMIWQMQQFVDQRVWLERVNQLAHDLSAFDLQPINRVYSGHPGMAAVLVAVLFHWLGASQLASLQISVAIIVALLGSGIAMTAYALAPKNIWWLAAAIITGFHPMYLSVSPTNAVIGPAIALIALLFLLAYQKRGDQKTVIRTCIALGLVIGLGMATRIPTTPIAIFLFSLWMWKAVGFRPLLITAAVALASMIILDPLWWQHPVQHIQFMVTRSSLNLTDYVADIPLRPRDFLLYAPFAILSIIFGALYVLKRDLDSPLPRQFLIILAATTLLFSGVFLNVHAQSIRHFFPFIFTWEVLLPLMLIPLASRVTFPVAAHQKKIQKLFPAGLALSIAVAEVFLLLYALHLPAQRVLIDWHYVSPLLRPHSKQE